VVLGGKPERFFSVARFQYFIPRIVQDAASQVPGSRIIVDDQDLSSVHRVAASADA
jgi:hypothetical protein